MFFFFKLRPIIITLDGNSYPLPWTNLSAFMDNMSDKGSSPYKVAAYPHPVPFQKNSRKYGFKLLFFTGLSKFPYYVVKVILY